MKPVHPIALFRLSVLGPLASREHFTHGELKKSICEIASKSYNIPNSKRVFLSEKTIEGWYYAYKNGDIDALAPKVRQDAGTSKLSPDIQKAIIAAKEANLKRSVTTIIRLLEEQNIVVTDALNKSTVYRVLKSQGLNQRIDDSGSQDEHRAFVAEHANDLWQGDVMHGPKVLVGARQRKTYLVSFMDDASRLLTHSEFYLDEGAVTVENVLKQAILKRGLPKKIIIDNGAAYRSTSLQGICARLKIRLVYCRPYHPEGKGKLEKWHRTVRDQFLSEIDLKKIHSLEAINSRLWVWLGKIYHTTKHSALTGLDPQTRYQRDLKRIQPLGIPLETLDDLFAHRHPRKVRKDGTISFNNQSFEVAHEHTGKKIVLVVNPLTQQPLRIESSSGQALGSVTPLDAIANNHRKRHRATPEKAPANENCGGLVELLHDNQSVCPLATAESGEEK